MRAKEFTNFNFEIEPYEGWTGEGVVVRAYDGKDEVGHVIFEPTEDDTSQWYAVDVEVEEPYQRRGIATKMYDMAKKAATSAGAIIVKSHTQTDAGRGLWQDKNVWEQTVNEYKEYPTQEYEGVTFTMKEKDGQLRVKALNDFGIPMGEVIFNMDGKELDPQDLEVYHKYQGQGIARVMYDYIKSRGFIINRSWDQTDAGAGFWNKHRGEDVRVWEDATDSPIVYHGNQGGIHRELITPMWWTESKQDAINYATQGGADGWVYSARLTCKNPYVIKPTDETNTVLEKYKQLMKQGYDSIYDSSVGDWIPFNAKDIHLVGKPEYQEEINENVNPQILYHATYRPLLKSIKQHGLGGDKAQAKWEDSKPGVVYLSTDPDVAESYAESSDVVPEEWLDTIVILKIDASKLDQSKLMTDQNVLDNSGDTLEYHGVIPVNLIS